MVGLVLGAVGFGALAASLIATGKGEPEAALPAVQAMGELLAVTVVGLGAYGLSQGGTRREV